MNRTKTVALVVAILLMVLGFAAGAFALVMEGKKPEEAPVDGGGQTTAVHDDVEYHYDDEGTLVREVYYKDNVYNGQKDYYDDGNTLYEMVYDKDGKEIASKKTEYNILGSITKTTARENGKIVETVEYDYGDDLTTVKKKTVKAYEGETELAEKTYFSDAGKKTRVCKYKDGALTDETFYDENGNVIENGGETVED